MSTSDERQQTAPHTTLPQEPLTATDTRRANAEALQRAQETSQLTIESQRHARVEMETRRLSAEMTRQAQERRRLERERSMQSPTAVEGARENSNPQPAAISSPGRSLPEPITIDRVLVALDGSSFGERALPFASALASWVHGPLTLAHVRTPEPGLAHAALTKIVDPATSKTPPRPEQDIATYLDDLREQIATTGTPVETVIIESDTVPDGLAAAAQQTHAGAIVLATHVYAGIERRILGGVGDRLIQRTHLPLLLIPPGLDITPEQMPVFQRVLVPLDGSELAEQALAPVLALARGAPARGSARMEIVLYNVADTYVTRPDGMRYVQEVRDRLHQAHLPASVSIDATALVGSTPGAITSAALHGVITESNYPQRFDLVVMATHGRGGIQRWVFGSTAEYVLAHVAVPTLLVHPENTIM